MVAVLIPSEIGGHQKIFVRTDKTANGVAPRFGLRCWTQELIASPKQRADIPTILFLDSGILLDRFPIGLRILRILKCEHHVVLENLVRRRFTGSGTVLAHLNEKQTALPRMPWWIFLTSPNPRQFELFQPNSSRCDLTLGGEIPSIWLRFPEQLRQFSNIRRDPARTDAHCVNGAEHFRSHPCYSPARLHTSY